jgi:hypothetical protein
LFVIVVDDVVVEGALSEVGSRIYSSLIADTVAFTAIVRFVGVISYRVAKVLELIRVLDLPGSQQPPMQPCEDFQSDSKHCDRSRGSEERLSMIVRGGGLKVPQEDLNR